MKPTPAIEKTWEKHKSVLQQCTENIKRYHSDYNLINYCAKTFQSNGVKGKDGNFAYVSLEIFFRSSTDNEIWPTTDKG